MLLACALPVAAQTDAAGEWAVTFSTPSGPVEFTMYVTQEGPRLSGRLTSDAGEFPLRGTINGGNVTITWTFPDAGKMLEITFEAKVEGDQMNGTAKLGDQRTRAVVGAADGQIKKSLVVGRWLPVVGPDDGRWFLGRRGRGQDLPPHACQPLVPSRCSPAHLNRFADHGGGDRGQRISRQFVASLPSRHQPHRSCGPRCRRLTVHR